MCYSFITDRIDKKGAIIEYFPKEEMTGDFFINHLQGSIFASSEI